MKNEIITLIHEAIQDNTKLLKVENLYSLYDQLQYSENIIEMAEMLVDWLYEKYKIDNIDFSLFDLKNEISTEILKKGEKFYLDEKFSFYFIINTHTNLNAVVSFNVDTQEKYDVVHNDKQYIDAIFFQISPILQNGILKKIHIDASSVDSVTNVYNRHYLIDHIQKIITLSNKKEETISFLMIGIDAFKAVIEEFDFDIGDKVLVELAKVIHKSIDNNDNIVARLTGDEFVIALVNLKSNDEAESIAKKLVKEFANTKIIVNSVTQQVLQKTICIGISSFPADSDDINQVLKNADNFLNEAKNKGRGKIAIYNETDNSTIDLF
ncbi:MAG: GGDEF domain-containing protein [Arcobacteraceae bacterium]